MAKFVLDKMENIEGKEKNAGYQHFFLFPRCFQKAFSLESLVLCGKELLQFVNHLFQCNNKEDFIQQLKTDLASLQRQQKDVTEKVCLYVCIWASIYCF